MVMRKQWFRGVSTRKVWRKRQKKIIHTLIHTNTSETDVGCHAWPPTVHNEGHSPFCSRSLTVNTILSHWASFIPPCCPPSYLCFFSCSSIFRSQSSLGQKEDCEFVEWDERGTEREREWQREQICRTAWRPAWGHACHFSFHPSHLLAVAYVHTSAYCTWASAELRWVGGWVGGGRGNHRPQHLFSSQAICSVNPGLPVGLQRTHTHTHTTARPPTGDYDQSWFKMVEESTTNTCSLYSLMLLPQKSHILIYDKFTVACINKHHANLRIQRWNNIDGIFHAQNSSGNSCSGHSNLYESQQQNSPKCVAN